MFEIKNISAFDNVLTFDIKLLTLSILFIFFVLFVWFYEIKKTGWKFDFWHAFVGLKIIFPLIIMYPFSQSIYNYNSMDEFLPDLEQYMPIAFFVSFIGCICLYAGRLLYDWNGTSQNQIKMNGYEKMIFDNISNKRIIQFLIIIYVILFFIIYSILSLENRLYSGRDYFQSNTGLRPVFNLTISIMPHVLLFCWIYYVNTKNLKYLFLSLLIFFSAVIFGTRSILIEPILIVLIIYAAKHHTKFKLRYVLISGILMFLIAFLILMIREERLSLFDSIIVYNDIIYGNSFSDLRDFACFLSVWDFDYLLGKSYLAGIISFIPSFISEFRQDWSLGILTAKWVGFDPEEHPGLRIGTYGELFINFGYVGVIVVALIIGYLLRHIDVTIKKIMTVSNGNIHQVYVMITYIYLIFCVTNSVGFFSYYSFIMTMVFLYMGHKFYKKLKMPLINDKEKT